ncbi:hypothetical protein WME88_51755 [Sorangium sp. So ce216]
MVLLFAISASVAIATPTPLLQRLRPGTQDRVFPVVADQDVPSFVLPNEVGGVEVVQGPRYGCIQLQARDEQSVGPVCNRHLHCIDEPPANRSPFEVYRLRGPNTFYVETGSACHSACCDWRGMSFTGEGKRLDDGVVQRLSLRLGLMGLIGLGAGFLCGVGALLRRTSLFLWLGAVACIGVATAMLWWNH